jgi:hypothetical protein
MDTRHHRRARGVRSFIVFVLAALMLLAAAASATAAPTEPTLTVDELRAKLESGPLTGYMKTVMSGYAIEQIPVTVDGLVEWSSGSMILFESSDPRIIDNGGVAAGMSGSPLFVDDGGVDKLIGAVSYGDWFTLKGMALATPIQYMASVEDDYPVDPAAPGAYPLREPVTTSAGTIDTVVVARSQRAAKRLDAAKGTTTMAPLAVLYIGGVPPQSKAYKELAAKLEKQTGLVARPAVGSSLWTGPPAPAIEGGSSVCQIFTLGVTWYGAAGTATYVNGDHVVAFGHPSWWTGPCGAAMTAGWVTGVWPSTIEPYKMIAPRDVKGVITQDRNWGIAGVVGMDPDFIPVNAHVSFPEESREVTTESSCVQWAFQTDGYQDLPSYLLMDALWEACDAWAFPGSAETVLDVVVSDETGTYTVHRENTVDSYDITWDPIWDAYDIIYELGSDWDGVLNTRLESVDFDATVSAQRIRARFVDIELPNGLHTGDNLVRIHFYGYGSRELKVLETTLTLPEGKPRSGQFEVIPANWYYWWDYEYEEEDQAPDTLAEIVDDMNARPKDSDVILTFYPREEGSWGSRDSSAPDMKGEPYEDEDTTYDPVEVTIPTDWVFDSYLYNSTVPMFLDTMRAKADYGQRVRLFCYVGGVEDDVPVDIYRVDAKKGTETFVKTVTAEYEQGSAFVSTRVQVAPHNTTFVARVGAIDDWLPGYADELVKVRPAISLGAAVSGNTMTITARVKPADTGGKIAIQRFSGGRWRTVKSATVPGTGVVKVSWKAPGDGVYRWRAKTSGSTLNLAGMSAVKRVVID